MSALAAVPPLPEGECQVWWASPALARPWHLGLLDAVERARREGFRRQEDRDRHVVAVALTRVVLGAHLGVAATDVPVDRSCGDCGKPHGKPRVSGLRADLHFSISHSGERVAVAVARRCQIGIDVEQLVGPRSLEGLERHVLSVPEIDQLRRLDAEQRPRGFLRYWTRKEAVLKATGDGLRESPASLTVTPPAEPAALLVWASRPEIVNRLTLRDLDPGDGYVASLAVVDGRNLTARELDAEPLLVRAADVAVRPA